MSFGNNDKSQQLECALIVLYLPKAGFWDYLHNLSKQFAHILLIDNTPNPAGINENLLHLSNVIYHQMGLNTGIAKALNTGCKMLFEKGYNYLVCFDQDTRVNDEFSTKVNYYLKKVDIESSLLGSGFLKKSFFGSAFRTNKNNISETKTIITSGMILSNKVFYQVGGFNENYFIDSVDHEYCLRARKKGIVIFRIDENIMTHLIGEKNSVIPIHTSQRKYFIFRNTIITVRRYGTNEPIWAIKQIFRLTTEAFHAALFEKNKKEKLSSIFKGTSDGLKSPLDHYE